MTYAEYLRGKHWRRLRMKVWRDRGKMCELCGASLTSGQFDVHHWTYANVPKEKAADVSVVCRPCHTDAHEVLEHGGWAGFLIRYSSSPMANAPVEKRFIDFFGHVCYRFEIDAGEFCCAVYQKDQEARAEQ